MNFIIEPLIIFMVLFFPGICASLINLSWASTQIISFHLNQEVLRIVSYNIPALALIWYFLLKNPVRSEVGEVKPQKKDLFEAIKAALGLFMIGAIISICMNFFFPTNTEEIHISGILSWLIVVISCMTTGYTEESYFRVYLLNHLRLAGISRNKAVLSSCVLFAVCHMYQGPVGFTSSLLAGLFLSYRYIKKRSIHGIALGHGLYNIAGYVLMHIYSVSGVSM